MVLSANLEMEGDNINKIRPQEHLENTHVLSANQKEQKN